MNALDAIGKTIERTDDRFERSVAGPGRRNELATGEAHHRNAKKRAFRIAKPQAEIAHARKHRGAESLGHLAVHGIQYGVGDPYVQRIDSDSHTKATSMDWAASKRRESAVNGDHGSCRRTDRRREFDTCSPGPRERCDLRRIPKARTARRRDILVSP